MAFWGDYHTHTIYSHGKGTVEENIVAAIKLGYKEIAITDHGFKHMTYNVRRMDWPFIQADVSRMKLKYPMIKIYCGLETNIVSHKGDIDLLNSDLNNLEIVVCAYHKFIISNSPAAMFKFHLPNIFGTSSKRQIQLNTDAYVKALEKNEIDIIAHPNYGIYLDIAAVAEACKHFGTFFELNGKRINMTDTEIDAAAKTGVTFICNSDAHSVDRVGNLETGLNAVKRIGIPFSQVANWEKIPEFRSHIMKKRHGLMHD